MRKMILDHKIGEIWLSDAVEIFVAQATQFCDFIDCVNAVPLPERLQSLSELLARLYIAAINLPDVEPTDREFDVPTQKPHMSFDDVDGYWEVFDPYEAEQPLMASLTDDITDIYSDLKKGLLMYERGADDDIADAVWHWKCQFEMHWGFHLVDALRAMHWAVQRMMD
jgi:hypothetical protein